MTRGELRALVLASLVVAVLVLAARDERAWQPVIPAGRREVVLWHLWGGKELAAVNDVAARFNRSQTRYVVRPVAMPGNNLDVKFFLSVAGGHPPDVVNQDDPIVADWAARGALVPLDHLASPTELRRLRTWLFPAARELATYKGRLVALPNGLDVRALYYDRALLEAHGLGPPRTLAELDRTAEIITPPGTYRPARFGFLPNPRRIWSWGYAFGGEFYDPQRDTVTADHPAVVRALEWMASYGRRYGAEEVLRFRKQDQALAGSSFPLLGGRYAMIVDGQWRVAEVAAAVAVADRRGLPARRIGVVPLPAPPGGPRLGGWINGNRFVVPRGSRTPEGAWELMKFWSGFGRYEADAAQTCVAGGWIPVSAAVVRQPVFQEYVRRNPDFGVFVAVASSPHQRPTPAITGASLLEDEVVRAAEDAIYGGVPARQALREASRQVNRHRQELSE